MDKLLKHPVVIIVITSAVTLFFAVQLPRAELDNNNIRFVPYDDEARVDSAWVDDTFGSSLFILIGLQRKYGNVFDADFLNLVRDFSENVESMDIVGSVDSLMNTDYISGDAESILVENLVPDDFTGSPEEINELKRRVNSWNIYDRSLVSDDFSATQIYVPLTITAENASDPEVSESFLKIRDMAHEQFDGLAEVYVAGIPVVSSTINEAMGADLKYLVPIVIIVILVIVYLPLKRLYFVIMSLLAVLTATVWAIGAMPLFNVKLSIISTVLPVILIAVGNSYGLHVMVHYIEGSGKDFAGMTRARHTEFVAGLAKFVRRPIFLAAVTTTVSFIAFCFTSVMPMRDFGAFAAFGVFASFILSVTFTPAVLMVVGPGPLVKISGKKTAGRVSYNDRIAALFVRITKRKWLILFITALVVAVSVYGASKLVTDNVFIEYFKDTTDLVKSDKFIRDKFGGSKVLSVAVEADSPEIILHPDTLCAMDGLAEYLAGMPLVGKVMGFSDFIKRANQVFNIDSDSGGGSVDTIALLDRASSVSKDMDVDRFVWEIKKLSNYDGASYYEIPSDPARYGKDDKDALQRLIGNYLIMLGSDDNSYSNDPLEPTAIKSTVMLRTTGQLDTGMVVREINDYIDANFPKNIKVTVAGGALVEGSTNRYVVNSVWVSMIIAFIALFFIVSFFNRSVFAGMIGVIPLVALVLLNFAVMGFLGIRLNIATAMIASVSMGIGIDYTVHFMEAYKHEAAAANYMGDFLFSAYRTSGIAIIADAVSTGLGFAVLMLSQFKTLGQFGLLIMLSLLMSAVVGLVIIPVILNWAKPKFVVAKSPADNRG
ncbi:MAG: MMPL family transporter [Spirochaetaceae bacterium]|jgi:predicted RND superfamily exporter protein|nr:MMPL family transporter [Spirochaetaceae bacterium]